MLKFTYTPGELCDAMWRLRWLTPPGKVVEVLFWSALVAGFPILLLVLSEPAWRTVALVVTFSLLCAIPLVRRLVAHALSFFLMLDRYGWLLHGGSVSIKINDEGIDYRTPFVNRQTSWNELRGIILDADHVFLQVGWRTFDWIPVRAFKDDLAVAEFVALCQKWSHCPVDWHLRPSATRLKRFADL